MRGETVRGKVSLFAMVLVVALTLGGQVSAQGLSNSYLMGLLAVSTTNPTGPVQLGIASVELVDVVDADGVRVGRVHGGNLFQPTVLLEFEGQPFMLFVTSPYEFHGGNTLYFDGENCSGQLYLDTWNNPSIGLIPFASVISGEIYLPDLSSDRQQVIVRSRLDAGSVCRPEGSLRWAIPAFFAFDLDDVFTPPFTLESAKTSWVK
jgi:hypothetical protein